MKKIGRVLTIFIAFVMAFSCATAAFATGDYRELLPSDDYKKVMSIWIAKLTSKMLYWY